MPAPAICFPPFLMERYTPDLATGSTAVKRVDALVLQARRRRAAGVTEEFRSQGKVGYLGHLTVVTTGNLSPLPFAELVYTSASSRSIDTPIRPSFLSYPTLLCQTPLGTFAADWPCRDIASRLAISAGFTWMLACF